MKGIRFYLEYKSPSHKWKGEHSGNVFAAFVDQRTRAGIEGMGAVYFSPDSPVCGTSASWEWLRENTKRISEAKAREIHPELFKRLDEE